MFWEQIESQYKVSAAHQFLLHFNVNDLLHDGATQCSRVPFGYGV